jgi:hypothetical protein
VPDSANVGLCPTYQIVPLLLGRCTKDLAPKGLPTTARREASAASGTPGLRSLKDGIVRRSPEGAFVLPPLRGSTRRCWVSPFLPGVALAALAPPLAIVGGPFGAEKPAHHGLRIDAYPSLVQKALVGRAVSDSANVGLCPTLRTSGCARFCERRAVPDSANVGHSPTYQIVHLLLGRCTKHT